MKECKKRNESSERQQKITEHMSLIYYTVQKLRVRLPTGMSREDLLQYGWIGLLEAIDSYEESKGKFSTFATIRIRGAILDGMMKYQWLSRSQMRDSRRWREAQECLETEKGRSVQSADIAQYLHLKPETEKIWQRLALTSVVYSDSLTEAEQTYLQEEIAGESWAEKNCLAEALQRLDETERRLLEEHYFRQKPLSRFAQENQKSRSWAYQVHQRALRKLKKWLC